MIPKHIALIMDGNGRWATNQNLPRNKGHEKGISIIKDVIDLGIKYQINTLTFYCFSTENWNRPQKEVDYLMKSLSQFINKHLKEFIKKGVHAVSVGSKERLPEKTRASLLQMEEETKNLSKINVNFAINYGSKEELINAIKLISKKIVSNEIDLDSINQELLLSNLEVKKPVDLLIRTSGEKRLSNFLLYQLDYAELYFTDVYWPDFNEDCFEKALDEFNKRERRYGGLKNEN